jgi:3-dehydroquinate synthase
MPSGISFFYLCGIFTYLWFVRLATGLSEMDEKKITVGLGERSYPILIRPGLLSGVGEDLAARNIGERFCVISDDFVAKLYGKPLMKSLHDAGLDAELITFPRGEASKNMQTIAGLASELARCGFDRSSALIALGGGVSGDMGGFLAAIYMRGIPFVQVPTTLLAQVDSSVGGKTGVDIGEGKNLIGCFYQPRAVYIDPAVLTTLPRAELLGGLAEVIKYGVIRDKDFFAFLEEQRENIVDLKEKVIISLIARCCEIKAEVVAEDEREGDVRRILNFGHTIGHAVEAASGFTLIHGLSIAIGMRAASDLAVLEGCLSKDDCQRICSLIESYGMDMRVPVGLDRSLIKKFLLTDKKRVGKRLFFILPEGIGRVRITSEVEGCHIDEVIK